MQLLGLYNDSAMGPDLLKVIADGWINIMQSGLPKDTKEELIKKYPCPSNCTMLKAPELNPEIKPNVNPNVLKKDYYQQLTQSQLGTGINVIGQSLSLIIDRENYAKDESKFFKELIAKLGDAGRLLTDLHFGISKTRRLFILPFLSLISKSITENCKVDTLLFGKKFAELFKNAASIESSKGIGKPKIISKTNYSRVTSNYNLRRNRQFQNAKAHPQKFQKTQLRSYGQQRVNRNYNQRHRL